MSAGGPLLVGGAAGAEGDMVFDGGAYDDALALGAAAAAAAGGASASTPVSEATKKKRGRRPAASADGEAPAGGASSAVKMTAAAKDILSMALNPAAAVDFGTEDAGGGGGGGGGSRSEVPTAAEAVTEDEDGDNKVPTSSPSGKHQGKGKGGRGASRTGVEVTSAAGGATAAAPFAAAGVYAPLAGFPHSMPASASTTQGAANGAAAAAAAGTSGSHIASISAPSTAARLPSTGQSPVVSREAAIDALFSLSQLNASADAADPAAHRPATADAAQLMRAGTLDSSAGIGFGGTQAQSQGLDASVLFSQQQLQGPQ
jgi:hypothetical protein